MPEETDLRREKQRLRGEVRQAAAALPQDYRSEASRKITEQVLALEAYRNARVVMAYVSLPGEPDTHEILADAHRAGKAVLLPRCVSPERMEAQLFTGWEDLLPGSRGIPEPRIRKADGETPEPDLILVPCITASSDGKRLGHGAGYYDRFLAGKTTETVCLCFRQLIREEIPTGPLDQRMSRVITDD